MHSRIFQISKEPILEDEYIVVEDYGTYDDSFVGSIADYVSESPNRKEDLEWLASRKFITLGKTEDGYDTIVFNEGYKKSHFGSRLETLKRQVEDISLESFSNDEMKVYTLKILIEDKFGFYFEAEGWGRLTFDSLIREYVKEGETYYIGGTLDYHC